MPGADLKAVRVCESPGEPKKTIDYRGAIIISPAAGPGFMLPGAPSAGRERPGSRCEQEDYTFLNTDYIRIRCVLTGIRGQASLMKRDHHG
jgi:hypothetical protein